jgi:hypothetical protein
VAGDRSTRGPRWRWLAFSVIVGIFFLAAAGQPRLVRHTSWSSFALSVLVNFGTAFVLAAIAVLLEPRLAGELKRVATEVVEGAQETIRNEVAGVQEKVKTLAEQTAELLRARHDQVDDAINALKESPSFQTTTRALELANGMRGLAAGIPTVQGGTDPLDAEAEPLSVRVRFLWGNSPDAQEPSLLVQAVCEDELYLPAHPELIESEGGMMNTNDRLCAEINWAPGDEAAEVGVRLFEGVQGAGVYRGEETLDWEKAVRELAETLRVAIASRRGSSSWPIAPLFELVGDDWAITLLGVEYRERADVLFHHAVWGQHEFPSPHPDDDDREGYTLLENPPGVPAMDWRLWKRAVAHLPLRDSPNIPSGWSPVAKPVG